MTRDPRCGVCWSASGIGGHLLTLVILMLVGMGFTLMSASAFADDDHERWSGGDNRGANNPKRDYVIPMNYELGMHCTGFEFAYCCVLPPYNSILAQVIKTQNGSDDFAQLLEADPNNGTDFLSRETVLRVPELDGRDNFKKYVLRYWHEAQPRNNDPYGKDQTECSDQVVGGDPTPAEVSTGCLISNVEGNSLFMWNAVFDVADQTGSGPGSSANVLKLGTYNGASDVVQGDGTIDVAAGDNYANGWLNHLYIYSDLEGSNPANTSLEENKIRLGLPNDHIPFSAVVPTNSGPAFHPMGPGSTPGLNNVLTFSTDHGTVVFTQAKVLENLPIMLTSPRIWEALGLPLTPFEDSIGFFNDPGLVDEESIRPYVAMKAQLHHFDSSQPGGIGGPVMDNGQPAVGFGTAPIDIPNCERCHAGSTGVNEANTNFPNAQVNADLEYSFWKAFYGIVTPEDDPPGTDSDWYPRLKAAALSILTIHDEDHGTQFTTGGDGPDGTNDYPQCGPETSVDCGDAVNALQTRLGHESVICQKCHADNVIAVVKSANCGPGSDPSLGGTANEACANGTLIPPVTEAIHNNHRSVSEDGPILFADGLGRDGGCQGCHPAHRSDGNMEGYPITETGDNLYDGTHPKPGGGFFPNDNRLANGGCFVGRDVHSNPGKDSDGAGTPSHLNAVGAWLAGNDVAKDSGEWRGIWCTNCHTQLSQEIWKAEDCNDLIHGDCEVDIRGATSLGNLAVRLNDALDTTKYTEDLIKSWLDPKDNVNGFTPDGVDHTHRIWDPAQADAFAVTAEVIKNADGTVTPVGKTDADGDFSVNVLSFCTTDDCLAQINDPANRTTNATGKWRYPENGGVDGMKGFTQEGTEGFRFRFNVATDGRDHWLSPGEPHCADCHTAPYTEQSGNNNPFPPFNYPAKASLMRYSRGHRDITCQGCHESIHGLYPVTPDIDTTSYAQAAWWNSDDTHGPLKCGTCHQYREVQPEMGGQVPTRVCAPGSEAGECDEGLGIRFAGVSIHDNYDAAVSWAHTFTDEHDPRTDFCLNCHGDESDEVSYREEEWLEHAMEGRVSRKTMDQVEILQQGFISGDPAARQDPRYTVCRGCHDDEWGEVSCSGEDGREWKRHLTEGRVSQVVWEYVSKVRTKGSTCGW